MFVHHWYFFGPQITLIKRILAAHDIAITLIVNGLHRCSPPKTVNSKRLFRPRITLIKRILDAHDIAITLIVKGFHRLLATDEDRLNRYKPKMVNYNFFWPRITLIKRILAAHEHYHYTDCEGISQIIFQTTD